MVKDLFKFFDKEPQPSSKELVGFQGLIKYNRALNNPILLLLEGSFNSKYKP